MKALCFEQFGNPDVLQYKELNDPIINPNEIIVRTKAIGLNFADIYRRRGDYHLAGTPPFILGYEGAGIVEKVGAGVTNINPGDRIAFADVPFANAELVAVPSEKAIKLLDSISFETAASVLLQGLTAHYLTKDSYEIKQGDIALVHAAAGGVGQLLIQMIKLLGGKVIGLTSSKEKAKIATLAGADAFLYTEAWHTKVVEITNGDGVNVVYESVGSTLEESLMLLKLAVLSYFTEWPAVILRQLMRMLMDTSKTLTGGDLWNVLTSYEER